jgi:cellulose synthase/poly-beta-1,6-N-acetylglucosamine synthase-like glycosyltransferase
VTVLIVVFWCMVAILAYTYVGFPAIVFLRGRLVRRPVQGADITPRVSVLIAAYNEARSIKARLDNLMEVDYPRDLLEVIVASDGSTDGTDDIVRQYADRGIRLLSLPRGGKNLALNAAAEASTGEILVFSDANTMYAPDAIRALVRPFADPQVGGVAGDQRYLDPEKMAASSAGERTYWGFDRKLKQSQSQADNAISATGAIYAIRRSLYHPVPPGVMDDFVISTQVIAQGYRLVFASDAMAFEPVAGSTKVEFGRKSRGILLGLRSVSYMRRLLNPFRYGFYSIQLFSHKVLRRLMVYPLLVLFIVSLLVWRQGLIYTVAALGQLAIYGLALIGLLLSGTRIGQLKIFTLPFYFCMVYAAALVASIRLLGGQQITRWETARQGPAPTPETDSKPVSSGETTPG